MRTCPATTTRRIAAAGILTALLLAAAPASAESPGEVVRTDGRAWLERDETRRIRLAAGDPVEVGDRVRTSASGRIELAFVDGSHVVLGGNGDLVIDEYLFKSEEQERESLFSLWSGRVRAFVRETVERVGRSVSGDYRVRTRSAVAGVRGTEFVVSVVPRDPETPPERSVRETPGAYSTEVAVLEGSVSVGSAMDGVEGEVVVTEGMETRIDHGEPPGEPTALSPQRRRQLERQTGAGEDGDADEALDKAVEDAADEAEQSIEGDSPVDGPDAGFDELDGDEEGLDETPPIDQSPVDGRRLDRTEPSIFDLEIRVHDDPAPEVR